MSENSNTNSNDNMTVIENNTDIESFSVDKKDYMPNLYYKYHNDLWRNGNQQSTWELLTFVRRELTKNNSSYSREEDDHWIQHLYNIIRSHPKKYGDLALNDNWCHHFTDEQLQNFYNLVENTD